MGSIEDGSFRRLKCDNFSCYDESFGPLQHRDEQVWIVALLIELPNIDVDGL